MTVGHGSPRVEPAARRPQTAIRPRAAARCGLACARHGLWLLGILVAITAQLAGQDASPSNSFDGELRIVWGGPVPRPFEGRLAIDRGTLTPLRNLSLQADSVGTIHTDSQHSLVMLPHSPSQFGGLDVHVRGDLDSQLSLVFKDPFTEANVEHTLTLGDIVHSNWIQPLDERGSRVAVERQLHDKLRVDPEQASSILETAATWRGTVGGYRTGLPAGEYNLLTRIVHREEVVHTEPFQTVRVDTDGSFPPLAVELPLPDIAGGLTLEFSLSRRRFLNNLVGSSTALTRRLDVVTVARSQSPPQIAGWRPLLTIDMLEASRPGSLDWLAPLGSISANWSVTERWQQFNPLSMASHSPISHGQLDSRKLPSLSGSMESECLTLAPAAWIAVPLDGLQAGVPHRLRMRLPTDLPMDLAMSVRSANQQGILPALSADSGFTLAARECSPSAEFATHDLIFWPTATNSYVLVANTSPSRIASVADIQLEIAELEPPSEHPSSAAARSVGIYLDKPLMADSFAAERVEDPLNKRPLESWQTWYEAAERLGQYMHWSQANTLVLKVAADGGAIFPCDHLAPSRRFDSGLFFSDGRSVDIKDYVELLLQQFDRDNRRLILALDIDTALPGLERHADTDPSLLQHDLGGNTWPLPSLGVRHRHSRYNLLNTRVQAEYVGLIREIVDRYAHHPAFAGIALQLDSGSQFVFAGDKWGYDDATLKQFEQASQAKLPPREQLPQFFLGPTRLAFLSWRASEVTKLFASMASIIQAKQPQAKLYLNAVRLWEDRPSSNDFYDPDTIVRNPSEYLMAFGIDPEQLDALPNVVLMQGSLIRSWDSVDSQEWMLGLARHRALHASRSSQTAAIVIQQPGGHQLASLEQLGDVNRNSTSQWIFPHSVRGGVQACKDLIDQIYAADPALLVSGGWLPVPGQEQSVRTLFRTLRELPQIPFEPIGPPDPHSNLRARRGRTQDKAYLQLINNAPWPETVALRVNSRLASPTIRVLGDRDVDGVFVDPQTGIWTVQVPAFDLLGLEINDPSLEIVKLEHACSQLVKRHIGQELAELEAIIASAGDPTQQHPLANLAGDFEDWPTPGKPLGWNVSSLPDVHIYRSNEFPRSGKSALVIENGNTAGASAWVQSEPFAPPKTGRLAVNAWLRAPSTGRPIVLRLSVVGRLRNGERFERFEQYGGPGETRQIANDWGRRPATLYVADLPLEDLTELRIAIDLVGPGKVWVDDVEVFASQLHPDERIYLRGQVLVAKQKLAENNPYPAEQLLDSHWGRYLRSFSDRESQPDHVAARTSPIASPASPPAAKSTTAKPFLQQWRDSLRERWRR